MNHRKNNSGVFWGFILVIIGILFLLDNFYILDFGYFISTFWPLILIAIGIKMLVERRRDRPAGFDNPENMAPAGKDANSKGGRFSESNVFGDVILNIKNDTYTGGSVNNVFGDIRIDLSGVKQVLGNTKSFTSGVFGDITIVAPAGIPIRVNANSVAGDITVKEAKKNGLFSNLDYRDENYEQSEHKITIQCSLVFGAINIY